MQSRTVATLSSLIDMTAAQEASAQRRERTVRQWHDACMTTWLRAHWHEEDVTFLWEVGDAGWVTRSVELVGPDRRVQAAAALDEVLGARDTGGIAAVQAYESRYGVVPEKPLDDGDPHEVLSQSDFERAWADSRQALEP